jgi:predicted amidohydrolase YtcJ
LADIIVLDRDILARDTQEIEETRVLLTLLGGKPVHSSDISATNKQ